jgi:phospholipid/cholesterol/gamma-HCH transport system permease protein
MVMVAALGRWANRKARDFSYALGFLFQVISETVLFMRRKQVAFRVLVLQILFTGVEALSIVSLVALSIGAVIIVEGGTILPRFGQTTSCTRSSSS